MISNWIKNYIKKIVTKQMEKHYDDYDLPYYHRVNKILQRYETEKRSIENDIIGRIKSEVHTTVQYSIDKKVEGEKFIDDIVERIRRKQL